MDKLYLLQYTCLVFMLTNAAAIGLSSIHVKWINKQYEKSRWMIFIGLIGLTIQYFIQLTFGLRATGDDLGAAVNMLIYTPCFSLISMGIYNIETTQRNLRKMNLVCGILYACIIASFIIGKKMSCSYHIGRWLYVMETFYIASVVFCIVKISKEMKKRRNILDTMSATDMIPYLRYSHASIFILFIAAMLMPIAILSTKLLFIVAPLVLPAVLFFTITFVALGYYYVPTEELLSKEEEAQETIQGEEDKRTNKKWYDLSRKDCSNNETSNIASLTEKQKYEIEKRLKEWCAQRGYKDPTSNMLTLSRQILIPKEQLSIYFDKYLNSTYRIWLSDIRFKAVQEMMMEYPEYSNDIISIECGFSSRTSLYRIFKSRENCTPTEWRDRQSSLSHQDCALQE